MMWRMRYLSGGWERSCGVLGYPRRGDAEGLGILDLHAALEHALAPILESNRDRHIDFPRSVVEGADDGGVSIHDDVSPHLVGARELAVVGVEFLEQDYETTDLRMPHVGLAGDLAVD